jgi:mono/diheme cytochrome c family protein
MSVRRFAVLALALASVACASREAALAPAAAAQPFAPGPDTTAQAATRGQQLAARTCAGCHAVGPVGASPMAEATPFREVVRLYPLDRLEEAFAQGLVTSHPAMPAFVFRASEIDDLVAYLEPVKAEP